MIHDTAELDRTLILKFEQASSAVLTNPTNYGLGALIFLVIKCISGLRDNSAFTAVLKKLNMWVPSVHEGAYYSISLALQALQMYHKLFSVVIGMSSLLFPTAMESYPKHVLVGIYKSGLSSEQLTPNPFTRVVHSLGVYEYKSVPALFNYLLDLFTSNSHELAADGSLKLTWGSASRNRANGRQTYIKAHPTLNAFTSAAGYDPLLDTYEVTDAEVDEYLHAMVIENEIDPEVNNTANEEDYEAYEEQEQGYLRSIFAESEQIDHLNALATLDAPCWVHFGHALFDDPKPCSRGSTCKHSHEHTDPALADLYRARHRDMHLKMLKTRQPRSPERRVQSHGGRQPQFAGRRGHFGRGSPHATRGPPSKGPS